MKEDKPGNKIEKLIENSESSNKSVKIDTAKILKSAILKGVKPMLATLVDKPFDYPDWQYEVKWDGYRALAILNKGKVEIKSVAAKTRSLPDLKEITHPFKHLCSFCYGTPWGAIICGVIVTPP